jgi:pSer/pThr/pTyr-binding forkhead associated (FHA) protein
VGGDPSSAETFDFAEEEILIGRDVSMDLVVDYEGVSRRHARVVWHDGQFWLEDMDSTNGTFLNGVPVTDPAALDIGDEIRLGVTATLIFETSRELKPKSETPDSPPELPQTKLDGERLGLIDWDTSPELVVIIAGVGAQRYTLSDDVITIGRADDNDIVIASEIVSRHHAQLERVGRDYQFVPHPDAVNLVLLEGQPIRRPIRLSSNDELRIGGLDPDLIVTMTYLLPSEITAVEDIREARRYMIEIDEAKAQRDYEKLADGTFFKTLKGKVQEIRGSDGDVTSEQREGD